jgi:hypothetical protein
MGWAKIIYRYITIGVRVVVESYYGLG